MSITVLGQSFPDHDTRREHFRNELRKHLPELKKMEGFPLGEDEDIIALSDPPYYTACPNPWLNDFIAEWEAEKAHIAARKDDFEVEGPYASDVSEGKNNPIYNAHSYHTKVPHPAIMRYILHYTQPGDIVFDGFAGTGMTGVAAQMCSKPDPQTKALIELEFKKIGFASPVWGERKAVCNDLSPIASFISSNYSLPIDVNDFSDHANEILNKLRESLGWMYRTNHGKSDKQGWINYVVWSEVHICDHCSHEFLFNLIFMDQKTKRIKKDPMCPNCSSILEKGKSTISYESYFDKRIGEVSKRPIRKPILINYSYQNKKFEKLPDDNDFKVLERINSLEKNPLFPSFELPEMQMTKVGRVKTVNISHIHQFFLDRPQKAIAELWEIVSTVKDERIKKGLQFFVEQIVWGMSLLNRFSPSHFSQVNRALSGVFYVAAHISEVSPWYILEGKLKRLIKAFNKLSNKYSGTVTLVSDAANTGLNENSVDYIFTDPPFGENLYYSDLNILLEAWHKVLSNPIKEAIVDRVKGKDEFDYQRMIQNCFKHNFRILKPGKWMTVEFSNTSAAIWNGIQIGLQNAGFILANVAALDKKQGTFQAVNSPTAVKQDLVISCYKPSSDFDQKFQQHQHSEVGIWDFVEEHLQHLPVHMQLEESTTAIIERSPKILFDRLIAFYVQRNLPVPIDAGKFQLGLKQRFVERDGMYFTEAQVAEYDQKRAKSTGQFMQLSIMVSSEQDGVLWLKARLSEQKQTYQDLHPHWMKALGGLRKGDILPELAELLEENFLKDAEGRWYVPDPENEVDLEKLRNKRLLRQFAEYREIAAKPKGKIKEARVEALRAGFKQCYQEKDFATIVAVGDRLLPNLLMEDEVLLQFYDIAGMRV